MFPKGFLFLFISFLLLGSSSTRAQEYQVVMKELNIEDGLSSRFVFNVFQDSRGYMWFDTHGYGLNRYDGYKFKLFYDEKEELVKGLPLEDKQGNIWVLNGQTNISDYTNIEETKPSDIKIIDIISNQAQNLKSKFGDSLPFEENQILQIGSQDSLIWIRTKDQGFYTYDGTFRLNKEITDVLQQHQKIFFVKNDKFIIIDENEISIINTNGEVLDRDFFDDPFMLIKILDGSIKLITQVDEKYVTYRKELGDPLELDDFYKKNTSLFDNPNCGYFFDTYNTSYNTSLHLYCHKIKIYDNKNQPLDFSIKKGGIGADFIEDIYLDNNGLIWLATGNGVKTISIQKNPFKHYLYSNPSTHSTRGIAQDNNHNLYINSYGGSQIVNLKTDRTSRFNYLQYHISKNGFGFLFEKDTTLWMPASRSIYKFNLRDSSSYIQYLQKEGNQSTDILTVYRDSVQQKIWVGGSHHIYLIDSLNKQLIEHKFTNTQVQPKNIRYFHENKAGLWLATGQGIFLIDLKSNRVLKHYHKKNKTLPFDRINHIHEDKSGILWLAGRGGLIEFNPTTEAYKKYERKDGFLNSVIYSVYGDNHGNLWLSTQYGLVRFNKETKKIQTFLPSDGISHEEFNNLSHFKAKDGTLYFGGLNGVNAFHPDSMLSLNPVDKPFYVVDLKLIEKSSGEFIDYTAEFNQNEKIVLEPGVNSFLIKFSLLDFISKENITYAYKLEGIDKNWQYQKENFVRFNNLPYGNHTLRIKAQGQYGKWTENELAIPIKVQQPFYSTNWFYALCIGALLFCTYLFFRLRIIRLRKRQLALEKEVAERTHTISQQNKALAELNSTKDRFFSIIGHDLRGPLTAMTGLSKKVDFLIKKNRKEELYALGSQMDNATENVTKLLDNLLSWALIQNGNFSYHPESLNLYNIVSEVLNLHQNTAEVKGIHLDAKIPSNVTVFADRNGIKTIIRNLVDNALKFTDKNGTVLLSANIINDKVSLQIADTGSGMSPELIDKLFILDSSNTNRQHHSKSGTGLGLVLCKDLIEMNKGTIEVESKVGKGTTFIINLPTQS